MEEKGLEGSCQLKNRKYKKVVKQRGKFSGGSGSKKGGHVVVVLARVVT